MVSEIVPDIRYRETIHTWSVSSGVGIKMEKAYTENYDAVCKERTINKGSQRMVWKPNRMIYSYTGLPRYMPAYDTEHGTKSDREADKGHSKPTSSSY